MANYFISRESCWVSPVCVDLASSTELTVSSLKLAVRGACGRVLVVLVIDDNVAFEATFDSPATGLLSFVPPPHILQTTGILVVYVVLCDAEGRISEIVDCGKTLVFPKDAAVEVRSLFDRICADMKQFFKSRMPGQQQQVQQHASAVQQQKQQQLACQQPLAGTVRRVLLELLSLGRRGRSSRTSSSISRDDPPAGSALGSNSRSPDPPDAATLYTYEHFLLPFVRHWAAVLRPQQAVTLQPGSSSSTDPAVVNALALQVLRFMVDNEMWASAVLLLDRHPAVSEYVVNSGLEMPSDFCNPIVLERKRRSCSLPPMRPVNPLLQPVQLQQQHAAVADQGATPMQSHAPPKMLDSRFVHPAGFSILDFSEFNPTGSDSATNDDSSFESATEILRRLLELQQQRVEQEALEQEYLQQQHVSDGIVGVLQQGNSRLHGQTSAASTTVLPATAAAAPEQLADVHVASSGAADIHEASSARDFTEICFALAPDGQFAVQLSMDPEEQRTMVPKNRPPQPLHQTLERTSCSGEEAAPCKALNNSRADAAPPAQDSSAQQQKLLMLQQQQQLWSFSQGQQQQMLVQQYSPPQHDVAQAAAVAAAALPAPGPVVAGAEQAVEPAADGVAETAPALTTVMATALTTADGVAEGAPELTTVMPGHVPGAMVAQTAVAADHGLPGTSIRRTRCSSSCVAGDAGCGKHLGTCVSMPDCQQSMSTDKFGDCGSSTSDQPHWPSSCIKPSRPPVVQPPVSFTQHFAPMLHASFVGFRDSCMEQSYIVFKNHSAAVFDTTALLICSGMLLAAITRSVDYAEPHCLGKLAVLLVYGAAFFFPYAVMQNRRQVFLRNREVLLVIGRSLAAFIVMLVALGRVVLPDAWMKVVENTLALQLQNGFILPSCQQLRPRAAAMIALAHLPSDMFMIALSQPLAAAFLQSFLVQLCSVVTAVVLDVWCRHRYMQRYLGVAGAGLVGPVQQVTTEAGYCKRSTSCSLQESDCNDKAGAAVRRRHVLQRHGWK